MFLYLSCCPEGLSTLFKSPGHQYNVTHNDSYVLCADSVAHQVQVDEHRFCASGNWENIALNEEPSEMSIRNVNGKAVIKYWGNDKTKKLIFKTTKEFDVNSRHYCVRNS